MSYTIEPIEPAAGHHMKRPYTVKINGEYLRNSNGIVTRFKDSHTAAVGGAREVDRRKRLALHMASQMPASDDSARNPQGNSK